MGVKGLWKLLEPCGRRIHVETLENTTLAVDVSIWMTQFVKAMRDEEGRPIKNAHVIGMLRRVAKLLYHGVRPVIVFDGGVPALKERLIRQRRMRRERREDDARSTAKRLLAARLRAEALRRKAPAQNTEAAYAGGFDPGSQGEAAPTRAPAPRPAPTQPSPDSSSDDDDDGCEWERGETADGLGVAADGDASAVDVEALIALPPAVRKARVEAVNRKQRVAARRRLMPVAGDADEFSATQLSSFLRGATFRQRVERAQAERGDDDARGERIHSDPQRRFVLMRDDENGAGLRGGVKARMERFLQANDEEVPEEEEVADDDAPPTCAACGRRKSRCACALRHGACTDSRTASFAAATRPAHARQGARRPAPRPRPTPQTVVPLPGQSIDEALEEAELRYVEDFPEEFAGSDEDDAVPAPAPADDDDGGGGFFVDGEETGGGFVVEEDDGAAGGGFFAEEEEDAAAPAPADEGGGGFVVEEEEDAAAPDDASESSDDCAWEAGNADEADDDAAAGVAVAVPCADPEAFRARLAALGDDAGPAPPPPPVAADADADDEVDEAANRQALAAAARTASQMADWAGRAFRRALADSGSAELLAPAAAVPAPAAAVSAPRAMEVEAPAPAAEPPADADADDDADLARALALSREAAPEPDPVAQAPPVVEAPPPAPRPTEREPEPPAPRPAPEPASTPRPPPAEAQPLMAPAEEPPPAAARPTEPPLAEAPPPEETPAPAAAPEPPAPPAEEPPPAEAPPADDANDAWAPHRKAATEGGFYEVCPDFDAQLQFALDNAQEGDLDGMAAAAAAATDPRERAVYAYVVAAVRAKCPQPPPETSFADAARADALDREAAQLRRELARSARDADSVTDEMREDVMGLLDDLGVPYIVAPMEAEAQCAALELAGLVEGTITDDSDAFCFGAKKVYKNIFDDKKFVEAYFAEDCRRELKLGRCEFVSLALLLGGDYAHGVKGVGIVNAMEVLQAFHFPHAHSTNQVDASIASLRKFGRWLDDVGNTQLPDAHVKRFAKRHRAARSRWEAPPAFPNREAAKAYVEPRVADEDELARQLGRDIEAWDPQSTQRLFDWREPDEKRLRKRCALELNWAPSTAAAVLDPVFKRWAERKAGRQRRVDAFFDSYHSNKKNDTHTSKRLRRALDESEPEAAKQKKKRKRRVVVESEEEDEEDDSPAAPRPRSSRAAAAKAARQLAEGESGGDD